MTKGAAHEDFSRKDDVTVGSERSFGLVFAAAFAIIGLLPLRNGGDLRFWALGVAGVFLVAALVAPRILKPLNLLWFRFGMVLHHIVTPVVMGLMFFIVFTPVGLMMRATGKDPMRLRRQTAAASYWIMRQPPGPAPDSMKTQF